MRKIIIPVLFLLILQAACKKDPVESKSGFVSIVESDLDYTTRSCFQMADGNYLICGSNVIWPAGTSSFGSSSSMMAKFSQHGDLIWQKQLPGTLYDLGKGIALPNGNFLLAGLDSMPQNSNVTIAEYNSDGIFLKSNQIVNYNDTHVVAHNQVDIIKLSNGDIAMLLAGFDQSVQQSSPRVLIFDPNLNIVSDKIFPALLKPTKNYQNQKIVEGINGKLYICGRTQEFNAWSWTYLMAVDEYSLDMDFFTEKMGGDTNSFPGPFVVNNSGHVIIPTAEQYKAGIYFNASYYFYYHLDEYFSIGKTVSAVETDANGNFIARHKYNGFSSYASLTSMTQTNDGGYLFAGVSNIITDAIISSQLQILLIKTNSALGQEWMKQINTSYPAVAVDVKKTDDGGFLIGAYEKSLGKNYKMMLIKTDANGNM